MSSRPDRGELASARNWAMRGLVLAGLALAGPAPFGCASGTGAGAAGAGAEAAAFAGEPAASECAVELPDGSVIPRPIHVQPPAYPAEAYEQGIEGWVLVAGSIGPDGRIVDAEVVDSAPPEIFDDAALSAFRAWRYCPPSAGSEQPDRIEHQLRFQLGPSIYPGSS